MKLKSLHKSKKDLKNTILNKYRHQDVKEYTKTVMVALHAEQDDEDTIVKNQINFKNAAQYISNYVFKYIEYNRTIPKEQDVRNAVKYDVGNKFDLYSVDIQKIISLVLANYKTVEKQLKKEYVIYEYTSSLYGPKKEKVFKDITWLSNP